MFCDVGMISGFAVYARVATLVYQVLSLSDTSCKARQYCLYTTMQALRCLESIFIVVHLREAAGLKHMM